MVVRLWFVVVFAGLFVLFAKPVDGDDEEATGNQPGHNPRSAENVAKVLLGSACEKKADCTIINTICKENKCECDSTFSVQEGNQCLPAALLGAKCGINSQCFFLTKHSECNNGLCACIKGYTAGNSTNSTSTVCLDDSKRPVDDEVYVDPTMIGVLVGLIAMFIVMCVVLRMFSKARFAENRTVFNSPRLLKLSLAAKRSDRRASNVSIGGGSRPGSRRASVQSGLNMLRKSPTNSLKGSKESLPQNSVHIKAPASPVKQEPLINVESPTDEKTTVVNVPDNSITAV